MTQEENPDCYPLRFMRFSGRKSARRVRTYGIDWRFPEGQLCSGMEVSTVDRRMRQTIFEWRSHSRWSLHELFCYVHEIIVEFLTDWKARKRILEVVGWDFCVLHVVA